MNSHDLETLVAKPIQEIGMAFYFDKGTSTLAKEHELNVFEFYGVGRGGVLGDVDAAEVADAFWFFHRRAIDNLYGGPAARVSASNVAASHVEAAYAFADRTFDTVDASVLSAFAAAARKVIDAVPTGEYALFDGYRKFAVPTEPVRAAYLATVLLRELRGGVHIVATREVGVEANEACFITNEMIFKLHGYNDAEAPERSDDLVSRMAQAEKRTDEIMQGYLDVLSDAERQAYADGVVAMDTQLKIAQGAAAGQ